MVCGISGVLCEERSTYHHVVSWVKDSLEDRVHTACGAAGHDNVLSRNLHLLDAAHIVCHLLADIQVACVGHIAIFALCRGFYIVDESFLKLCRGFDIRVSKSKVKDILCPILCGKLCTCLKHLADPG